MFTVESIIHDVFGDDAQAAAKLGVGRTAVLNWKAWGHFPSHVVVRIWQAARERNVALDVDQIPATPAKPKAKKVIRGSTGNARTVGNEVEAHQRHVPADRE